MENGFTNLTAKVWANYDDSRAMVFFFQSFGKFLVCRPFRRHSATICDVTTIQLANGTVQKLKKYIIFL